MKRSKGFTLIEVTAVAIIAFIIIGIVLSIGGGGCYSMMTAKNFTGKVDSNQPIGSGNVGWFANRDVREVAFSRAVSIELNSGEFVTFSTVDRQFATVKEGDCITIRVLKYAPWNFEKAGTYYKGRLKRKFRCPE